MTALERTLDTLFGDMDDLLSEHQKPEDEFFSYNGDRIYEPAPFTDRGRVMLDLLHKFQLMYPGIIITDTEFITSGYAAFKFPNIGPYHDVEVYINRYSDGEHYYEVQVQWGGYSQTAGVIDIHSRITSSDFDAQFAKVLGHLFISTFNGLTIFNNQERFKGIFQQYTCKDITEKERPTYGGMYAAIGALGRSFESIDWSSAAQLMRTYHHTPYHHTASINNENIKYHKQDFYEVRDKVVLQENGKKVRGTVKSIVTEPRKANKYFIKTERGTLYQLAVKHRSNAKVALLGKEITIEDVNTRYEYQEQDSYDLHDTVILYTHRGQIKGRVKSYTVDSLDNTVMYYIDTKTGRWELPPKRLDNEENYILGKEIKPDEEN